MESTIIFPEEFKRISYCTHITAVKFLNPLLFIAEGNELQVYNWKSSKMIFKKTIFNKCSIHGIRFGKKHQFLVFGAKHIKIISPLFFADPNTRLEDVSHSVNLSDWILDAQLILKPDESEEIVAALTAHNSLVFAKKTGEIIQTYHCAENCILYSASFISCEYNSLVLAVGTVFQKILLWSPFSNQNDVSRNIPFQQLSGHQGVIFSVTYSEVHKIICSTSDDRSVRIWKVSSKDDYVAPSLKFWESSTIEPIHVLYAHESRVWRSVILDSFILSIGEDSFICIWSLEGKLLKKIKAHKNGSIWCIDVYHKGIYPGAEENIFAITGGSDGGVYVWDLTDALQSNSITQLSKDSCVFQSSLVNQNVDIGTNVNNHLSTNNNQKQNKSSFPRICSLYTEGNGENILVYMGTEKLSMYNLESKSWRDVFHHNSISVYCVVAVLRGCNYIALGTISGDVCLVHMQDLKDENATYEKFRIHEGMIRSLHWCSGEGDTLLSCGNDGDLALWRVSYEDKFSLERLQQCYLPKSKTHWWSTAALYLSSHRILIVGDRGGSIAVFRHSDDEYDKKKWVELVSRFRNIHGDDAVTDIQEISSFIYSSGRDGKVHKYILEDGELKLLHALKVPHDLEWIGRIVFWDPWILLIGFHTTNFVVWSISLESAIMTVECGGGHRSWDFQLDEEGVATFVAIQKKDIIYCQQDLNHMFDTSVIKAGVTGQKICCLTYLYTVYYETEETMDIILCGGEDNTVRVIGTIHNIDGTGKSEDSVIYNLSGHLSSIRAIGKERMVDENKWILASVGGRAQMIIWKFEYSEGVVCEQLNSTQLNGCSEKSKSKSEENIPSESQTRLMDVCISRATDDDDREIFDIGVACSDSYFRLYQFDAKSKILSLIHTFKHDENCILKIASVGSLVSFQDISYIIGGTNGSLKVLRHDKYEDSSHNKLTEVKDMKNCHKSGINALDLKFLFASVWMICSGGDDNSLMIAFINLNALPSLRSQIKVVAKYHHSNAHASQITGVKILDPYTIASISVDQRLNVWKLNYTNSPVASTTINLHRSLISLIPDISHLECWKTSDSTEWHLAVCGQGYEVFTFENEDKTDYKELILHFSQDSSIKIF